jgi:hypothetical protein
MPWLQVGPTVIPVAPGSGQWDWNDAVDRRRAFDNTYRASATGGAARDFHFTTPPVTLALAATYRAALQNVAAQLCTGDVMEIPTMCCAELVNESPVRLSVGHRIVMEIALHEVQPKKLLSKYTPGDTIAGESFTRSTIGYQINAAGVLVSKAINTKRDGHFIGGVRSVLLEGSANNPVTFPSDISQAIWVKTNCTVGTGIADPAAGTTACTLTATAANATALYPASGAGPNLVRNNSVWLRRRTGTGVIQIIDPTNSVFVTVTLTGSWQRFNATGIASVNKNGSGVRIVTSGDAIDVWCFQQDDQPFPTSEIPAGGARGADIYSLPFTIPPQEMTVYAKFVDLGSIGLAAARVFQISDAAGLFPIFMTYNVAGFWTAFHNPSGTVVQTTNLTPAPIGGTTESSARLFGDGSVDLTQSVNGAAATAATQTAADAFAAAWSGPLVWLNSAGSGAPVGFTALQSFKIVAGARSLDEMRAA